MADVKIDNKTNENNKTEEKRIDVYELVTNYNKRSSDKLKGEFLKAQVKVKSYLGYGTKMFLAEQIIKNSCFKGNNVHIDSCKKYLFYIYTLIKYYTNIDIKETNIMEQYDLLDENGLVEKILNLIPEKEMATFKTILDMKQDDLMTNKYGTYAFIEEQVSRIENVMPEMSKAFAPLLEVLSKKIETLDENKIEKMLNKLTMMSKFVK